MHRVPLPSKLPKMSMSSCWCQSWSHCKFSVVRGGGISCATQYQIDDNLMYICWYISLILFTLSSPSTWLETKLCHILNLIPNKSSFLLLNTHSAFHQDEKNCLHHSVACVQCEVWRTFDLCWDQSVYDTIAPAIVSSQSTWRHTATVCWRHSLPAYSLHPYPTHQLAFCWQLAEMLLCTKVRTDYQS